MSVEPGKLLGQPPGDERLNREVGDSDRRAVVFRERARDHFALNAAGQKRSLANGFDGELGFGRIKHWAGRRLCFSLTCADCQAESLTSI